MHLQAGTLLQGGKYKIEKVLGQGGFGLTYLATQVGLNRKVAIKEFFMREYCNRDADTSQVTIGSEGSRDVVEKFRSKFVKEAQNIACLKHPYIISIYDVFEENGTAYYVMEYLDRGSLAELVKQRGRLSEADALRYIRQIADALRYIHARNMNHLDVKPGNILIDEADGAVLIDFGLSKRYDDEGNQTSTTPVGISHGYAPLEQYKKGGVGTFSPSTDIYSLGATLYKLATGDTPPDANDILTEGFPPRPAMMSDSVYNAIVQAMLPNKNIRPQSIEAFLALLDVPATPVAKEEVREDEETVVIEEAPSISPRGGRTPNIAEEGTANKQTKEDSPALSPLQGGVPIGGGGLKGTSAENETSKQSAEKRFSPKKLLWPLLICLVAIVAFFGVHTYNNLRVDNARLTAIEQHRLDSIAKVKEAARLEQLRKDSVAKAEEAKRLAEEKRKEEENFKAEEAKRLAEEKRKEEGNVKAEEAKRLAEEKRKEDERIKTEEAKKAQLSGVINGHEWVDLGLSVKWATCNVGASSPTGYGNYYAWGETSTKSEYSEKTYAYCNKKKGEYVYMNIGPNISGTQYDAARVNWGGTWRMPTWDEIKELKEKCSWVWTTVNGVNGYKVTGPNGNSIFLPAAGTRFDTSLDNAGSSAFYCSATPGSGCAMVYYLWFGSVNGSEIFRFVGQSVRPVSD